MYLRLDAFGTFHLRNDVQKTDCNFALSGVFALLVVSNLLGTILFAPVLTIYAISDGKWIETFLFRRALLVFLAQLLGAGMAGAYLLPALAYRRLFDLHQMQTIFPGFQFGLYFLNVTSTNLDRELSISL